MADTTTVTIHGLKELSQALQELPKQLRGKALGASVKAGADFIRDLVRAAAPVDTGAVKKSIMSYRKRGSSPNNITYEVGVTLKKKWPRRYRQRGYYKGIFGIKILRNPEKIVSDVKWPAFWWRYKEFGTSKMAATPFFRPAWDTRSGEALAMIKRMLAKAVEVAAQHVPKYTGGG